MDSLELSSSNDADEDKEVENLLRLPPDEL